jgi:hypothetical protein
MINAHERMKIIQTVYKVSSKTGTYEVKLMRIKGLRLRKKVLVKK